MFILKHPLTIFIFLIVIYSNTLADFFIGIDIGNTTGFGVRSEQYLNNYFTPTVELIFNILLLMFLLHFIWGKLKTEVLEATFNVDSKTNNFFGILTKTLGFTFLNPHVYSDTVFFLGNFSKNLVLNQKILFGIGASFASFLFFFKIKRYSGKPVKTP